MHEINTEIDSYKFFIDFSRKLQTTKNYAELYNLILEAVLAGTQYKNTWLFIIDENAESEAFMISEAGDSEELASSKYMRLDMTSDPMLVEIVESRKPVIVEDGRTDPRTNKDIVKQLGIVSIINFPIIMTDELIGVLGMGSFNDEGVIVPTEKEIEFVTMLSIQIAPVIVRILEKEARDLYEKNLLEASEVKNQFLSCMSHELRTPLNAIMGFAQLLQMGGQSKENQENFTNEILDAGTYLLNMVTELLDLGQIQQGQLWIDMDTVSVNELISECLQQHDEDLKQKELKIDNELNKSETFMIYANKERMKNVLNTLLCNAISCNENGGSIKISASVNEISNIKINIKDSGSGIPENMKGNIFIPFEQASKEGFTSKTSISLALAKQLVNLMGGDMEFKSIEGEGSNFWIILRGFVEQK